MKATGTPSQNYTLTKDPKEIDNKITHSPSSPGSELFSETPTVEGDYPQTSGETPLGGDRNMPQTETHMARNESNTNKSLNKPKSHKIDQKANINLSDAQHPIVSDTAAENVLDHHHTQPENFYQASTAQNLLRDDLGVAQDVLDNKTKNWHPAPDQVANQPDQ